MLCRNSLSTVDGSRPRSLAIRRIESPRSTPARISSRSRIDRYRAFGVSGTLGETLRQPEGTTPGGAPRALQLGALPQPGLSPPSRVPRIEPSPDDVAAAC